MLEQKECLFISIFAAARPSSSDCFIIFYFDCEGDDLVMVNAAEDGRWMSGIVVEGEQGR